MARVCIVCAGAVRNMVMVYMYTDYLKSNGYSYDMIYMDKYHEEEVTGAEKDYRIEYDGNHWKGKIEGYSSFVRESSRIIKSNQYQFIIVWGELTAALLTSVLKKYYQGKYCVNIRDLFVGKRRVLNLFLNQSIRHSAYVTVSSGKYLESLPKDYTNYYFVHSINRHIMDETSSVRKKKTDEAINILYIGNIRFLDHLYRLINEIKNDNRYRVTVAGYGSGEVSTFVKKNKIDNVDVYGVFPKEQTGDFLGRADVIYNLYGTEDINLRQALSNKLYYAVSLYVPILVYKDTYMYEISKKCGIGYAFDQSEPGQFGEDFYDWYTKLDKDVIRKKCDSLIKEAYDSQTKMLKLLNSYLD